MALKLSQIFYAAIFMVAYAGKAYIDIYHHKREIAKYGKLIGVGLLFSSIGEPLNPNFFLGGLGAFLVGHIFYIIAFYNDQKPFHNILVSIPFYIYGAVFVVLLWPGLDVDMRVPVVVYAIAIATMAASSFSRQGHSVSNTSHVYAFMGAVLFVVSDSLLAYNKFASPIPYSHLWVMITYYAAQLLISGSVDRLDQVDDGEKEE